MIKLLNTLPLSQYSAESMRDWLQLSDGVGYNFRIIDNVKSEPISCISIQYTGTIIASWKHTSERKLSPELLNNLSVIIIERVTLKLPLEVGQKIYPNSCSRIIISSYDNHFDDKQQVLYIKAEKSLEEMAKKLIFENGYTNRAIRDEILRVLYETWDENPKKRTTIAELQNRILIPKKDLEKNLDILGQEGKIHRYLIPNEETTMSVLILQPGIAYVDEGYTNSVSSPRSTIHMGDNVHGDKITATTHGAQSPIIIKSENVSVVIGMFDQLKDEINKAYTKNDKEELLQQIEEAKTLVNFNEEDKKAKLLGILGNIMTRTSEFTTIVSFVLQIISFLHSGASPSVPPSVPNKILA